MFRWIHSSRVRTKLQEHIAPFALIAIFVYELRSTNKSDVKLRVFLMVKSPTGVCADVLRIQPKLEFASHLERVIALNEITILCVDDSSCQTVSQSTDVKYVTPPKPNTQEASLALVSDRRGATTWRG
eukprot:6210658-Pleurochrysis_carterae.AAC.1